MTQNINPLVKEMKTLLESNGKIPADVARKMLLSLSISNYETNIGIHNEIRKINGRVKKVEMVADEWEKNPSLLWLVKNKFTKVFAVVTAIWTGAVLTILFFIILYERGFLSDILTLLGLPPVVH